MFKLTQLVISNILTTEQAAPLEDILDMHDLYTTTNLRDEFDEILRATDSITDTYQNLLHAASDTTHMLAKDLGIHFKDDILLTKMSSILRTLYIVTKIDVELKQDLYMFIPEGTKLEKLEFILEDYSIDGIGILTDYIEYVEDGFMSILINMLNVEDNESATDLDVVIEIRRILNHENIPLDLMPIIINDITPYTTIDSIPENIYNKYLSKYLEDAFVFTTVVLTLFSNDKHTNYINFIRSKLQPSHVKRLDLVYGITHNGV